jgi:predicted nucleic acid-binding protein
VTGLYLESSAIVRWLLNDIDGEWVREQISRSGHAATSVVTSVEVARALARAEREALISSADRATAWGLYTQAARGWTVISLTEKVLVRARGSFPLEPVRTLDAIHLSSVLAYLEVSSQTAVLSFDARVIANLEPLGIARLRP